MEQLKQAFSAARLAAKGLLASAGAVLVLAATPGGCATVPTGAGSYMFTVVDAGNGKPVEGVAISATAVGGSARGAPVRTGTTDDDGIAVLGFGSWGSVEVQLAEGDARERWIVMQDRVAVNGGRASREPMRLIVGSGAQGGNSRYRVTVTRVERGPKVDN